MNNRRLVVIIYYAKNYELLVSAGSLADRSTASSGQRRAARRRWAARTTAQPNKLPASDVHQTGQAAEGAAADGILGRQVRLRHPAKNCEAGVSRRPKTKTALEPPKASTFPKHKAAPNPYGSIQHLCGDQNPVRSSDAFFQ